MTAAGLRVPRSAIAHSVADAEAAIADVGLPLIVRPAFTLGGRGGGVVRDESDLARVVGRGLAVSPIGQVLLEESVLGWGEFELEVMRDHSDNVVIVCSIENLDPMGVHTGDSVCVAPQQTLTDKQYQKLRDQAIAVIRAVGVETGGSNVQFAVNPKTDEIVVIEMNPRVSRSSALASKATGFPIAKIAARLAVGYTLQEIPNDITQATPASFEPAIDYCVVKWPRFAFEKFPGAEPGLTTHMKSVGEVMAIGRTFRQAFAKAMRSRELDVNPTFPSEESELLAIVEQPGAERFDHLLEALRRGVSIDELGRRTSIDPWFLNELADLAADPEAPFAGERTFKSVDTCAAEFPARTPYYYSGWERTGPGGPSHEVSRGERASVVILGSGPNRIGQGIEFDYCCVHAAHTVRESGRDAVMINCNPETVSTDYDTSDRLYFEPLTLEDVLGVMRDRETAWGGRAIRRPDPAEARRRPARGRDQDPRYEHRIDRSRRGPLAIRRAAGPARLPGPRVRHRPLARGGARGRAGRWLPAARAPELRARRPRDGDRLQRRRPPGVPRPGRSRARPHDLPGPVPGGLDRARRRRAVRRHRCLDRRDHAARRGGRDPLRGLRLRAAARTRSASRCWRRSRPRPRGSR